MFSIYVFNPSRSLKPAWPTGHWPYRGQRWPTGHWPYTVQHWPYRVQRGPYRVQRGSYTVQRWPYRVQRWPYRVQHRPYTVQQTQAHSSGALVHPSSQRVAGQLGSFFPIFPVKYLALSQHLLNESCREE